MNQRFFPFKYFDSLAIYLSSNLYLCLCLSERDFRRNGKWEGRWKLFFSGQLARIVSWRLILPSGNCAAPGPAFLLLPLITLITILAADIWAAPCNNEELSDDFEAATVAVQFEY